LSPEHAKDWLHDLTATTPEDWGLIEFGGGLYWPAKINRLGGGAKWETTEVTLCVLDFVQIAAARLEAEEQFERLGFCDLKDRASVKDAKDQHEDLWNELDMYAQVARGLRTKDEPHGQLLLVENLIEEKKSRIARSEVALLFKKLMFFGRVQDADIEDLDMKTVIEAVHKIDEVRHLGPLVAIAGRAQDSFVISMAVLLASYLRAQHSQQSTETSTPVRSRVKSSKRS
jgi:hypothetical protein